MDSATEGVLALVSGLPSTVRGRQWMLMLQAFIDDSGSDKTSPAYILAGFLANVDEWLKFSDSWDRCLKADNLAHFKMTEAMNFEGPFEHNWNAPLRDQKIIELADIAAGHAALKVGVMLDRRTFDDFIGDHSLAPEFSDPYCLCFYQLIERINSYLRKLGIQENCDVIFDEQGKVGQRAINWFDILKQRRESGPRPMLINRPIFRDDKKCLPLQAADMIAWYTRRAATGESQVKTHMAVVNAWKHIPAYQMVLDTDYLIGLATGFLVRQAKVDGHIP